MLFPLLKAWVQPLLSSVLSSTGTSSKQHPSGFRTIGGGDGLSSGVAPRRKPASSKKPVSDTLSFSESEEHIVNDVKMQNLAAHIGPAAPTPQQSTAVIASNESKTVDDEISQSGDQNAKHVHETW
jgi:hypothetical protein